MGKPLLHEGTARGKNTVMAKLIFALILVLHTSILAGASYTYKKFENYRLRIPSTKANKDWAIGDLRVPDGNVEACKEQCDQDDRCKLFNYSRKSKRCWFKAATHDNEQGVGEWSQHDHFDAYEKGEAVDHCSSLSVTVLDDAWRATTYKPRDHNNDFHCDWDLSGWYRFKMDGKDANITTECVDEYRCGTVAPVWLDLEDDALPAQGQEKDVRACASWDNCCEYESTVTVRNCGDHFVYNINGTPNGYCNLAYCAE